MDIHIRMKDKLEALDIESLCDNWCLPEGEDELNIIQRVILHLFKRNISKDTKITLITSKINEIIDFINEQGANIDNL